MTKVPGIEIKKTYKKSLTILLPNSGTLLSDVMLINLIC